MKNIDYRKHLAATFAATMLMMVFLVSCKKAESNIAITSTDMTKPDVVTNVNIENLDGAAKITYRLPNSENLLYVLAKYNINDNRMRETKASYYTDTILVDGFARAKEYEVTLYAVSRANVMSDPVVVKVNPKTPNYLKVNSALEITPDFGGASFFGLNENRAPIAVHLLVYNETTNKFDKQEPEYISSDTINVAIRNLPPTPQKVGVFTTDRFGNVSDTVFKTLTPLFETQLDKSKFFLYPLANDTAPDYGWVFMNLFDNHLDGNGWHTVISPRLIGTFGLGTSAIISRLVIWQRPPEYYGFQNAQAFTIWGSSKDNPVETTLPRGSAKGTVAGDWVNMGNFTFPNPPSGLAPNQANEADKEFVAKGINFTMPRGSQGVKFVRYEVTKTWGGLNYVNAMEMTLFGNPL